MKPLVLAVVLSCCFSWVTLIKGLPIFGKLPVMKLEERQFGDNELSCSVYRQEFFTAEYRGLCYVLHTVPVYWNEARNKCRSLGGQLASIGSSDKYDHLFSVKNYKKANTVLQTRALHIWIDGRRINGQLVWTNGQLMTFSKPNIWGDKPPSPKPLCVRASKRYFDEIDCETNIPFLCEMAKRPTPAKLETLPTVYATSAYAAEATTAVSVLALATNVEDVTINDQVTATTLPGYSGVERSVEVQRQLTFKDLVNIGAHSTPKLITTADWTIYTNSLIDCAGKCMSYMYTSSHVCEVFNFYEKNGECRIYHDRDTALKRGAVPVIGWKLYQPVAN